MAIITGVEIFSAGTHLPEVPGFPIQLLREDLATIALNWARNREKLRPPLKLGHQDYEEGQPALGVAANLRVDGDKLLCDFVDVPDVVYAAISAGLYRQVSVELRFDPLAGWMLTGVALLGADLPAVRDLKDLQSYLSARRTPPDNGGIPAGATVALAFSQGPPRLLNAPRNREEDKMDVKELEAKAAAQNVELEAMRVKLKASEDAAKVSAERERLTAFQAAFLAASAPLEEAVKAGRLTPALRDKIVTALTAQKETFSASAPLALPMALAAEMASAVSPKLPTGEQGAGGGGTGKDAAPRADGALVDAIHKLMASTGRGYLECADVLRIAQPALFKSYQADFVLPAHYEPGKLVARA